MKVRSLASAVVPSFLWVWLAPSAALAQSSSLSGSVLQAGQVDLSGLTALDPEDEARLGWDISYLGDIDRDGNLDLAVGAPHDDQAGTNAGALWIVSLDQDSTLVSTRKIVLAAQRAGDLFGHAVASLGDVDGDGLPDLAVGAPGDDTGGANRGAVYVLFLRPDGSPRGSQRIAYQQGGFRGALDAGDQFGYALTGIGDLNGDVVRDLVVGAPGDDDGPPTGTDLGALYVLFLDAAGRVRSEQKISERVGVYGPPLTGLKLKSGDQLGCALASTGDADGDTLPEIVVGAWGADTTRTINSGAVFRLSLTADGTVDRLARIDADTPAFQSELTGSDAFGASVAGMGDLDRDGVPDIAVGVERERLVTSGAAWIVLLNPDGGVKAKRKITSLELQAGVQPGDKFGRGLAALGVSFVNFVSDGGLEGGAASTAWEHGSTNFGTPVCSSSCSAASGAGPRTGGWCLRFGGIAKRELSFVQQQVVIRSDRLSFFLYNPVSSGGTGAHQDKLSVRIDGTLVFQALEADPRYATGYQPVTIDVSAFNDGALHVLRLEGDITGTMAAAKPGRSDFLVDDIQLFETPRLGPLGMVVGAPHDDDLGTNAGALWSLSLEGALAAKWLQRNGRGTNPVAYTTTVNPAIGKTWSVSIARSSRTRTVVLATLDPHPGLSLGIGELLLDLASPLLFVSTVTAPATNPPAALTHSLVVPNDLGLVGLTLSTQGYRDTSGTAQLLNAIDLTIGH